ncbi:hypothetical protein PSCICO_46870 [Pseudomonas cichorii]|nr:hypothetical protein PSCICO_46870 [Pseudomonas cichorii]
MRMKPEHYQRLHDLSKLQHLSLRSQLILARRLVRQSLQDREAVQAFFREEVKKAEAGLPFTQRRLEIAKDLQRQSRDGFRTGLLEIGKWLYQSDEALTEKYGFDGVCDVLEVNPVHRPEVLKWAEDKSRAISTAAFIVGMEDSARQRSGRHPADWKEGTFFQVFLEMQVDLFRRKPELMPDPTAPGGPLYGIPVYHQQSDGTMARQSSPLTVHDAQGSRVVKRKIEVPRNGS